MSFSGFFVVEENTKRIILEMSSTRDIQQIESLIQCLIKSQLFQNLQCRRSISQKKKKERRQNRSPDLRLNHPNPCTY